MGNITSKSSGGWSKQREPSEHGHEPPSRNQLSGSGHRLTLSQKSSVEAPALLREVSNSQVSVGTVTVAGRDSISSTVIQYFPPIPQEFSGAPVTDILDWLSALNFRAILLDNLIKRVAGTGVHFLESETFERWLRGEIDILLGSGMPGAGKTVLASLVIEHLQKIGSASPCNDMHVGFAFLRYTDRLSASAVLSALVRQALESHPHLQSFVAPIYEMHRLDKTPPSQDELTFMIMSISKQFRIAVFAIDGLDEAHRSVRLGILKALSSCNVKLLLTSRPLERIHSLFPNIVQFTVAASEEDVEKLFDEKLDGTPILEELKQDPSLKQEVIRQVQNKSKGMFLYAALQVAALEQCLTIKDVRDAISNSPSQIEGLYGSTMKRIEAQHPSHVSLAMQTLSWLMYAHRSLSIEELQYALAMSSNSFKYEVEKVVPEDVIITVCCGLVCLEETSRFVRLIHYTAKDVLPLLCRKHVPHPHSLITSVCIARLHAGDLLESQLQTVTDLRHLLAAQPLLEYACRNWDFHAHQCDTFRPTAKLLKAFIPRCQSYPDEWYGVLHHLNPVQFAARYDFLHLFPLKNTSPAVYNSATKELGRTPLMIASWAGHRRGVRKLLKLSEIHINATDIDGRTAMALASFEARLGVVDELAQARGVDVNLCDKFGESPLMAASKKGHIAIVEKLLEQRKVAVNITSTGGRTALIYAAKEGWEDVAAELLLWHDVDVNAADEDGRTPLLWAVYQGHSKVASILLAEQSCHVNAAEKNGRTALMWACIFGFSTIARELMQVAELDVNLQDDDGQTALILASRHKHSELTTTRGTSTSTPREAFAEIATQLLRHPNTDVNMVDKEGRSALMWAAYKGCTEVVSKLLDRPETRVNLTDRYTSTALMLACAQGRGRVVDRLLKSQSLDAVALDRDGRSAIDIAAKNGHVTIVQRLLLLPQVSESTSPTRQANLVRAALLEREVKTRLASTRVDNEVSVEYRDR